MCAPSTSASVAVTTRRAQGRVEGLAARAEAERGDDRGELLLPAMRSRAALDVQDLAAQRQDGLRVAVAARARRRVALDDEGPCAASRLLQSASLPGNTLVASSDCAARRRRGPGRGGLLRARRPGPPTARSAAGCRRGAR